MTERPKTAIIMMGGGMRSAHGAGFLYALGKEQGITDAAMVIGTSGDSANVLYYVTEQWECMKKVWTDILPLSHFISFSRFWRIMDVDYLIDSVLKKQEPLDVPKLNKSAIRWFVAATDYLTGKAYYFSKADNIDPFEALRASKAIPVFFGKRVPLLGHNYIDGELGPTLEDHVRHAINEGADNILLISHVPKHTSARRLLMQVYAMALPQHTKEAVIRDVSTEAVCLSIPGVSIICVVPQDLPAKTATRNQKKLQATFDRGVSDARAMKDEMRELFGYPKEKAA